MAMISAETLDAIDGDHKARLDAVKTAFAARIAELEDFMRMEVRKMEMQANIMRDTSRTGGWEGAEKVAMAFERAAIRHREMLS